MQDSKLDSAPPPKHPIERALSRNLEQYCQFFKALSEPLRVRILHLLQQHESLCVCELMEVLNAGQSQVSRHLAYLKSAQLVTAYRKGAWMHYQLAPNALDGLNLPLFETLCMQFVETKSDLQNVQARQEQAALRANLPGQSIQPCGTD